MNLDDEIFLSAYLDGALDPDQRSRVETAMLSDHRLLDHLHSLAAVRELVAGLPRTPLNRDVSIAVVETIVRRRVGILSFDRLRATSPVWRMRAAAGATAAAAAIVALVLGFEHQPQVARVNRKAPIEIAHHNARAALAPIAETAKAPVDSAKSSTPVLPTAAPTPVAVDSRDLALTEADRKAEAERRQVRDLLDHPELLTMLVVNDVSGADAPRKVGEMLERTPFRHARFGRLTVSQGIIIDPKHPGTATVYAVVMEESELREFKKSLRGSFHDVVEAEPRPEVVTQLTQIDDVSVVEGRAVANLILPDSPRSAVRAETKADVVKHSMVDPSGHIYRHPDGTPIDDAREAFAAGAAPGNGIGDSLPPARKRRAAGGSDPSPVTAQEKGIEVDRRPRELVVLIWVTSPPLAEGRLE